MAGIELTESVVSNQNILLEFDLVLCPRNIVKNIIKY
jgi:hypothetical protein